MKFYECSHIHPLPCSLSLSTGKQQLTSQKECSFMTAAIVPLAQHTFVFSHIKHGSAAMIHEIA
jgi:hypothetical protein